MDPTRLMFENVQCMYFPCPEEWGLGRCDSLWVPNAQPAYFSYPRGMEVGPCPREMGAGEV
jgi:hypothetical protein